METPGGLSYFCGAATLGQPTRGYRYTPGASAFYTYLHNTSGWSQDTRGNDGRTGATTFRTRVVNAGQGDAVAYNFSGFVSGTREGSTSFLANPAVSGFNGDLTAGANGVCLNRYETIATDNGYVVSHVGVVINSKRSNGTGGFAVLSNSSTFIPAACVSDAELVKIVIRLPDVVSPYQPGKFTDKRARGLAVRSIRIELAA